MLGMDSEPGIYLQTLTDLFQAIEETQDNMEYSVSMSYLEVSPLFRLSWISCLCPAYPQGVLAPAAQASNCLLILLYFMCIGVLPVCVST